MSKFNEYKGLDLAGVADEVLARWTKDDTFHKSITTREGHPTFVFYEGPPSANGTPGIHHVMARTIKDVICRYKIYLFAVGQPLVFVSFKETVYVRIGSKCYYITGKSAILFCITVKAGKTCKAPLRSGGEQQI